MSRCKARVLTTPMLDQEKLRVLNQIDYVDGHWLWTGTKDVYGYGVLKFHGVQWKAHRLIYYVLDMQLSSDLVINHKCKFKHCVNPNCTEEVTSITNVMLGISPHAQNARKDRCPKGHEYVVRTNRSMTKGWQRYCPTCQHRPVRELYITQREEPKNEPLPE